MGLFTRLAVRIGAISWLPRLLPQIVTVDRTIQRVSGGRVGVGVREVTGAERAELWQVMLRTWPNFARYEERTDRVIPVFQLTRRR
ncbi:MAG: nitroreductase family deazaflavin-dependent oxidoreductase [Nocardioides sp.]|nr:nitroreductase family deazaflavin-dependent oxidoreductase [Nocardioides sp.]